MDEFRELTHTLNAYNRRGPTSSAAHAPRNCRGSTCSQDEWDMVTKRYPLCAPLEAKCCGSVLWPSIMWLSSQFCRECRLILPAAYHEQDVVHVGGIFL